MQLLTSHSIYFVTIAVDSMKLVYGELEDQYVGVAAIQAPVRRPRWLPNITASLLHSPPEMILTFLNRLPVWEIFHVLWSLEVTTVGLLLFIYFRILEWIINAASFNLCLCRWHASRMSFENSTLHHMRATLLLQPQIRLLFRINSDEVSEPAVIMGCLSLVSAGVGA